MKILRILWKLDWLVKFCECKRWSQRFAGSWTRCTRSNAFPDIEIRMLLQRQFETTLRSLDSISMKISNQITEKRGNVGLKPEGILANFISKVRVSYTLYNKILRIARNLLETRENIKIILIPMKISHKLWGRMDGSQFWCFPWFPANSLLCVIYRYTVYMKTNKLPNFIFDYW